MAGVSKSVREAMIEAAWLLIAERGLEGMATREVLARTGAPRGSVYHHFPGGRTELIEAAIDHSRAWMQDQIAAIDPVSPTTWSPGTSPSGGASSKAPTSGPAAPPPGP